MPSSEPPHLEHIEPHRWHPYCCWITQHSFPPLCCGRRAQFFGHYHVLGKGRADTKEERLALCADHAREFAKRYGLDLSEAS